MKKHRDSERSAGDGLEGDGLRKNSSCFSNIKIFLISECALMLAQGTVGAYLVSATNSTVVNRNPGGQRRTCVCVCGSFAAEQERSTETSSRVEQNLLDSSLSLG